MTTCIRLTPCFITVMSLLFGCPSYGYEASKEIKHVLSKFKSTWMFNYGMMEFLAENMKPQTARTKFILIWHKSPLLRLREKGQTVFKTRGCHVDNCFITDDHNLLRNMHYFDAVLFHAPETFSLLPLPFEFMRAPHQNYIFVSALASDNYPLCDERLDNYFNMTWTYKLNSDMYLGYIIIKDKKGEVIGPKPKMDWIAVEFMEPVSEQIRTKLTTKSKAAAWYISDCTGKRLEFGKQVKDEMTKYGLILDNYGPCALKNESKIDLDTCLDKVEKDYYFYFAFERYFSDDYVTGLLLRPLKHFAVPVVYGGADYSRFMPDGIYLNAYKLIPQKLVQAMLQLIKNNNKYLDYFKWHNYYSYHMLDESPKTDFYCQFCEKMNDVTAMMSKPAIEEFREWWMESQFKKDACQNVISRPTSIIWPE